MIPLIQRSRNVVIGITVVAMLVFAACGGGATPTPTPKPPPLPTASPTSRPATPTPVPAASTPELQPLTAEALARFAAYAEEKRESFNVPGMVVVVVQGGEVVFARGFGVREAGGNDPVTPDTMFSIGSTTKAMTSMMAATLVTMGSSVGIRPWWKSCPSSSFPMRTPRVKLP